MITAKWRGVFSGFSGSPTWPDETWKSAVFDSPLLRLLSPVSSLEFGQLFLRKSESCEPQISS